ncbi:hypothetical protein [Phenylobacterium sp.]|uniref:hypothetical protein n=1 Tax=Phenylobacterium sp. TaxID=1871053 RepID=UPI00301D42A9
MSFRRCAGSWDREKAYVRLAVDVSENVTIWGDATYGRTKTEYQTTRPTSVVSGRCAIQADNSARAAPDLGLGAARP